MFHDRTDAGEQLAETLRQKGYADKPNVLVLGIPRGGVIVAAEVARALCTPLDIVVTKKIGAPDNPEYAIGAVNLDGEVFWNEIDVGALRLSVIQRKQLISLTLDAAREKNKSLRDGRNARAISGKTVILVDDGIATGYTTRAALSYVSVRHPARLILAIPVAAPESLKLLRSHADEVVCLETPESFGAVGAFYEDFPQVEDEEVRRFLNV